MNEKDNLLNIKKLAESVLVNEVVERHSMFQLQCFNLAKQPTIQSKLHQCLKEIKSRKLSLDSLELEISEQNDQLEILDINLAEFQEMISKNEMSVYEQKRAAIKIRDFERKNKSIRNNLIELNKKQKDIAEEMQFFCSAFDQLNRKEKLKPWDDPEVQKEYWTEKLRFEVNTRLLLRQLPDIELMKTIMCLHDDSPIKKGVVDMLRKANEQTAALTQKQ